MPILALLGGLYCIIVGAVKKGKAYKSKMGTPLSEKEVKTVRITYFTVGALLLVVALVSGLKLLAET
ncbi:MAG: hypothetical protein NC395_01825 [Prevotella sp.]|nr:hypothetical protein [Prevotella sp.]